MGQIHSKLSPEIYKRYRRDPLFMYKSAAVCENCYLVYAEFVTAASSRKYSELDYTTGANAGSPYFDSKNYSDGLSVGAIIHQREKSFFNDVSSAPLQKGHPLAHLATSFRSIQQHPPGGFDKSSNAHTLNPYSNQPNLNKVFATKSVRDEKGNQRMQRDFFLNSSSKHHREFLLSTLRGVETHANTPNVLRTWAHQAAGGNGNNTAQAAP